MEHAPDAELIALGREFSRARRRCRRPWKNGAGDWAKWSSAIADATAVARRISRLQPDDLPGPLIRYHALRWLLIEQDEVIVDAEGKRAFVAFGRALRELVASNRE